MRNDIENKFLPIFSIFLLFLLYISIKGFFPVPQQSHFFVSRIDNLDFLTDESYQIYNLLKTPAYFFLKPIYLVPQLFVIFSYTFDLLIYFFLYFVVFKLTKNYTVALIVVIIFSPFSLFVLEYLFNINTNFFSAKNVSLTWGRVILSSRILFAICYILIVYFFLKKKYLNFYIFLFLSFLCHPNNSLIISSIFITYFLFSYLLKKEDIKFTLITIAVSILGMLPGIYRIINIETYSISNSYEKWFSTSIRDEADDFSVIWNILNNTYEVVFFFIIFLLTTVIFFLKKYKIEELKKLYYLICSTILIFISFFLIEIFITTFDKGFFFMILLGPFSAGVKALPQSYFLFIFFFSYILNDFLIDKRNFKFFIFSGLLILNIYVITTNFFNSRYNLISQLNYLKDVAVLKKISSPEKLYELKNKYSKLGNLSYPNIYESDDKIIENIIKTNKINDIYYENKSINKNKINNNYKDFEVYKILLKSIRENIPENSKIIIPPYLASLRDSLENYTVFFQEKHDGNLMFGSKKIFDIFFKRMNMLNIDYKKIPTEGSRLNYTYMRKNYLDLDHNNFFEIKKNYPNYNYVLTESVHDLRLELIYEDIYYKIYRIN